MDANAAAKIAALRASLEPDRERVTRHPLYAALRDLADLRVYTSRHVFAVWDFMCLLKRLQRDLTCVELPWRPSADRAAARLVNEIVLAEESDEDGGGAHCSHYELYRRGMRELGADDAAIESFQRELDLDADVERALDAARVPQACARFVRATWRLASRGALHEVAAAFALGREDVIPDMFVALVREADRCADGGFATLRHYLERHIHLDGDAHTPLALELLARLGGDDDAKWLAMQRAARVALQERVALWDGVLAELEARRATSCAHAVRPTPAASSAAVPSADAHDARITTARPCGTESPHARADADAGDAPRSDGGVGSGSQARATVRRDGVLAALGGTDDRA